MLNAFENRLKKFKTCLKVEVRGQIDQTLLTFLLVFS
jgi:hypothetical protein